MQTTAIFWTGAAGLVGAATAWVWIEMAPLPEADRSSGARRVAGSSDISPVWTLDASDIPAVETSELSRRSEAGKKNDFSPANAPDSRRIAALSEQIQIIRPPLRESPVWAGPAAPRGPEADTPIAALRNDASDHALTVLPPARAARISAASRGAPPVSRTVPIPTLLGSSSAATPSSLTPAQAAAIDDINRDFSKNVGGPNQNPGDPDYRRRWILAATLSEQQADIQLGAKFMDEYRALVAAGQAEAGVR